MPYYRGPMINPPNAGTAVSALRSAQSGYNAMRRRQMLEDYYDQQNQTTVGDWLNTGIGLANVGVSAAGLANKINGPNVTNGIDPDVPIIKSRQVQDGGQGLEMMGVGTEANLDPFKPQPGFGTADTKFLKEAAYNPNHAMGLSNDIAKTGAQRATEGLAETGIEQGFKQGAETALNTISDKIIPGASFIKSGVEGYESADGKGISNAEGIARGLTSGGSDTPAAAVQDLALNYAKGQGSQIEQRAGQGGAFAGPVGAFFGANVGFIEKMIKDFV